LQQFVSAAAAAWSEMKKFIPFLRLSHHTAAAKIKKNRLPLGCIWLKLLSFSPTATEAERAKVTTLTENIPVPEAADRI
jgi:hypothetical protein